MRRIRSAGSLKFLEDFYIFDSMRELGLPLRLMVRTFDLPREIHDTWSDHMRNMVLEHVATNRCSPLFSALAVLCLAWMAVVPPARAAEILYAGIDGDQLSVELDLPESAVGSEPWYVQLLDENGETMDSVVVTPDNDGGRPSATLTLEVAGIPQRGWQHRLELIEPVGTVADSLDVHLGLDCDADLFSCDFYLRQGLRVDGALYATPEMGDLLDELWRTPGAVFDLGDVVQARPDLGGITIQILIESGRQIGSGARCQCVFMARGPGGTGKVHSVAWFDGGAGPYGFSQVQATATHILRARFSTQRTSLVELRCMKGIGSATREILLAGYPVTFQVPAWEPCGAQCDGSVVWSLGDLKRHVVRESFGLSSAAGGYSLTWELGDTYLTSHQDDWYVWGTQVAPISQSDQVSVLSGSVPDLAPSSLTVEGQAWVELANWFEGAMPQGQVTAGAKVEATAEAACAASASFEAEPTVFLPGAEPSVIQLTVGPEDP